MRWPHGQLSSCRMLCTISPHARNPCQREANSQRIFRTSPTHLRRAPQERSRLLPAGHGRSPAMTIRHPATLHRSASHLYHHLRTNPQVAHDDWRRPRTHVTHCHTSPWRPLFCTERAHVTRRINEEDAAERWWPATAPDPSLVGRGSPACRVGRSERPRAATSRILQATQLLAHDRRGLGERQKRR